MVTALADKFLLSIGSEDIYSWVTAIFGEEWGNINQNINPHYDSTAIDFTNEIYILLADIAEPVTADGGTVGYFSFANNYINDAGNPNSNGRLIFFLDSKMYANPIGGASDINWDSADYWPKELYATLAHEFQHIIHFYQKVILNDATSLSETWLNEMCSAMAEEFVAQKLAIPGPRGVMDVANTFDLPSAIPQQNQQGRLPDFDYWPEKSLTTWNQTNYDYSIVYAFGAWLARNYGGTALFTKIVQNPGLGFDAVTSAITSSAQTRLSLLTQWGLACLSSHSASMPTPFIYNKSGSFGSTYLFGPINLDNYSVWNGSYWFDGLYIYNGVPINPNETNLSHEPMSNVYFSLPITNGVANGSFTIQPGQTLTVVFRDPH